MAKILFAFSGGIDDVLSIYWLRQHRGHSVVALLADVGQGRYLEPLGELALECGAEGTLIVDLRQRFLESFAFRALVARASYEDYLLATPLARYAICEELIRRAEDLGVELLGHGASTHGNDQVRFDRSVAALAPRLRIYSPLRDRRYRSLEEKREDLRRLRLPDRPEFHSDVSRDRNLWGCGSVHGLLRDPWESPREDLFQMTKNPENTPTEAREVVIGFRHGTPRRLDGEDLDPVQLMERLNQLGGEHGVGRLDHIENRFLGGKTREIYEAPGATLLYIAHGALEELTLTRELSRVKRNLAEEYGRLVYEGLWFTELREALDCFFEATQRSVTGRVRVRLGRGSAQVVGRESRLSLHEDSLTESPEGQAHLQDLARGVVDLAAIAARSEAQQRQRR